MGTAVLRSVRALQGDWRGLPRDRKDATDRSPRLGSGPETYAMFLPSRVNGGVADIMSRYAPVRPYLRPTGPVERRAAGGASRGMPSRRVSVARTRVSLVSAPPV